MVSKILVNTGSGNGLLPDGTKPLPEPVMTNHQQGLVTIWRFYYGLIKFFCDLKHIDWYDIMNMHRFSLLIIPSAQRLSIRPTSVPHHMSGFYTKGRPLVKSNLICPSDKLSWQPGCPVLDIIIQGNFCISQGNGSSDNLSENLV